MHSKLAIAAVLILLTAWACFAPDQAPLGFGQEQAPASQPANPPAAEVQSGGADEPVKEILSGRVVLLTDALKKRGVKTYAEEIKNQVVLVTAANELVPIVPDWRGRAFYQDERLRDRAVDLLVHRRQGVPWVQVLSIFTFDEQGVRNITDYWCDVCSIPMYEIKECECCQGPIRLRYRPQQLPAEADLKPAAAPRPAPR